MDFKHSPFLSMSRKRKRTNGSFTGRKRVKLVVVETKENALTVAKRALRIATKLRNSDEVKIHDLGPQNVVAPLAGIVVDLTSIAQGDTLLLRDGNEISAIFMEFSYILRIDPIPVDAFVRMVIVRDNLQVESTLPAIVDVFQTASVQAFKQRALPKRFTKLWSATETLTQVGANHSKLKFFRKKLNFNVRWTGVAGTTISKNGIYFMAITSSAVTEEPLLIINFRLHFTDS